jgi:hypothetical protein
MKNYFRKPITRAIAEQAIHSIGISSFADSKWVCDKNIIFDKQSCLMGELYDYYYPVHSKTYLEKSNFTFKDYITIVKQLLRTQGFELERKEACNRVSDRTYAYYSMYRIKNPEKATENFEISFS